MFHLDVSDKYTRGCISPQAHTKNFQDAMGELATCFENAGAQMYGRWSTLGYDFEASRSIWTGAETPGAGGISIALSDKSTDDPWEAGMFVGLALDEANQQALTGDRISLWLAQLSVEGFPIETDACNSRTFPNIYGKSAVATPGRRNGIPPSPPSDQIDDSASDDLGNAFSGAPRSEFLVLHFLRPPRHLTSCLTLCFLSRPFPLSWTASASHGCCARHRGLVVPTVAHALHLLDQVPPHQSAAAARPLPGGDDCGAWQPPRRCKRGRRCRAGL